MKALVLDLGIAQIAPRTNFGALIIAATLKMAGVETRFIQQSLNKISDEEIFGLVGDTDVVLFSCVLCNLQATMEFAMEVKRRFPGKKIIAGGDGPTVLPEYLYPYGVFARMHCFDHLIKGPGEQEVLKLLGLPQIHQVTNPYAVMVGDPDLYEAVGSSRIQGVCEEEHINQRVGQFQTVDGCFGQCGYCHSAIMYGGKIRQRIPAEDLAENVMELVRDYKTNVIQCWDLTFNSNFPHALEVCGEMKKAGVNWDVMCDPGDPLLTELIPVLADSNCVKIGMGIEVIHDQRKKMGKPKMGDFATVKRNVELATQYGLIVRGYFQIATPNGMSDSLITTMEDIAKKLQLSEIAASFTTPGGPKVPWPGPNDNQDMREWTMHLPVYYGGRTKEEWLQIKLSFLNAFYNGNGYRRAKSTLLRLHPNLVLGFAQHEQELRSKGVSI